MDVTTCECPRCAGDGTVAGNTCLLCAGRGKVQDSPLSEHFMFSELVQGHQGFCNDPTANALEQLRALCKELLEPVRAKVGPLHVTSGYRCPNYDAHVAGPPFDRQLSGHSVGAAADVQPLTPGVELKDVMDAAEGFKLDQRIIEGGCVHLAIYAPYPVNSRLQRGQAYVRMLNPDQSIAKYMYARYDPTDPTQLTRCV